jgi:hypothetical protein
MAHTLASACIALSVAVVPLNHQSIRSAERGAALQSLVEDARLGYASSPADVVTRLLDTLEKDKAVLKRFPRREQLLAISRDGEIVDIIDGTDRSVVVPGRLDALLAHEGADILLVHNHPTSTALSVADVGQLENPGVRGIVAIGADGSIYAAFPERRLPRGRGHTLCAAAQQEILGAVRSSRLAVPPGFLDTIFGHVLAESLRDVGVIAYEARPARTTSRLLTIMKPYCRFAREVATARLRRELKRLG